MPEWAGILFKSLISPMACYELNCAPLPNPSVEVRFPRMSELDLVWKQGRCLYIKTRSSWRRWVSNMTLREGDTRTRDTSTGECRVKVRAETGGMLPQTKRGQESPANRQKPRGSGTILLLLANRSWTSSLQNSEAMRPGLVASIAEREYIAV